MEEAVREAQRLRLRRFGMAVATYALVTIASFVTQQLGLGRMSLLEWGIFVAIAIVGNAAFLTLFLTGRNLRFRDPSLTREQIVYWPSGDFGLRTTSPKQGLSCLCSTCQPSASGS